MSTYNGSNLRVFLAGVLLGGETECSVSFSHEPRDSNTKDTGRWNSSEEGGLGAEISGSGFVVTPAQGILDKLFDALVNSAELDVVVGTNNAGVVDATAHRWIGKFRLTSFEESGKHRETRTYSYSLQSTGIVTSWNPAS